MKRLVLVDGHSLLHRAFHALPPLTTPEGKPIGAVYGLARMLLKVFSNLEPTYVGVAMEAKGPTFRHEVFKAYKEQRPEMDKELEVQIKDAHQLLQVLGIPLYIAEGYEGEDLIASLIKQACPSKPGTGRYLAKPEGRRRVDEVVIVSGDRDLFQLVGGKVRVFVPEKGLSEGKLYGAKEIVEKMGLKPEQVVDFKALCGDPSDNIPGVRGIGEKTAKKFLQTYGSLEGIYNHLDELPVHVRKLLEEGRDQAQLSRKIAKIVADVPVKLELKKWDQGAPKKKQAQGLFREFGFKSLLKESDKVEGVSNKEQLKLM